MMKQGKTLSSVFSRPNVNEYRRDRSEIDSLQEPRSTTPGFYDAYWDLYSVLLKNEFHDIVSLDIEKVDYQEDIKKIATFSAVCSKIGFDVLRDLWRDIRDVRDTQDERSTEQRKTG